MMIVIPIRTANMQSDTRRMRKAMQPMRDHLRAQISNLLPPEAQVNHGPGSAGDIDDGP